MLEQDFEKILAAYMEDELDDDGTALLAQTVQEVPAHRRRFQREIRIHTLLRESALVMQESDSTLSKNNIFPLRARFSAIAAAIVLFGVLSVFIYTSSIDAVKIGYCLHVSEAEGIQLNRNGKIIPIRKDSVMRAGDQIVTDGHSQASLQLAGMGMLTISGNSELLLAGLTERVAIEVKRGEILLEAEHRVKGSKPLIIQTPKAEVEVMGTVFGLEVAPVATRVKVHEGRVNFREVSTDRSAKVDAGQYIVNGAETLSALDQADLLPDTLMPGIIRLSACADLCRDRNLILNDHMLRVENRRRVSFLKFDIPAVGKISGARLRLKQSVDPGVGNLKIWAAQHNEWSENTESISELPEMTQCVGEHDGWVKLDQEIEVDVSSLIKNSGVYTLIMTLEDPKSNDIWFGSRESNRQPELILFTNPERL